MNKNAPDFKVNPNGTPAARLDLKTKNIEPARAAKPGEIPVIDISCLLSKDKNKMRSTAEQIRSACERIGFFYIVNHGVAQKVVDDAFTESKRFFDQSESFKQHLLFDKNDHGYKGPRTTTKGFGTSPSRSG